MALNASGAISLGGPISGESINLENAQPATATVSLNDVAVRSLAGVPTTNTTIIMPTDFYGKSNAFIFTLAAGTDINLRSAAISAGWPGSGAVQANISPGTTIQSSSTGAYALTINGSWPGGVTLVNSGTIVGKGGTGGQGGYVPIGNPTTTPGKSGFTGGTAILVSVPVTINNASGTISGGGGGGGGGGAYTCGRSGTGGGGGGGGGNGFGTGGAGGFQPGFPQFQGVTGTVGGALSGGPGGPGKSCPLGTGGTGGAGGSNAGAGSPGAGAGSGSPGPAGSGGNALSGNPLVTFPALGTIYGPRV
jgi:hypothetical protein